MLAATTLALQDGGVNDIAAFAAGSSALLGTTHGSCGYCEQYYRQIVQEGILAANPMLFAEGVPNSASAHVSLMLGLRGGCQTNIGTRTAGLDALALATRRIRTGRCDRVIVGAAEEWSALTSSAYGSCGMARQTPGELPFAGDSGFVTSAGSVVLLLESRKAARERGARVRAVVREVATCVGTPANVARSVACAMSRIGAPQAVISSANATWVDRGELAGIERACCGPACVTSMYGHIAEVFSVTPLAGIAAALLGGRLPRLCGNGAAMGPSDAGNARYFGVFCTDFTGVVSAVRVERMEGGA
jgi:hypothetical protein